MYDKEYIENICKLNFDFERFDADYTQIEFDRENAFAKYYSLNTIIGAIEKYRNGEIDDKRLAHWMTAYCYVLNGGFKSEAADTIDAKLIIEYEITDLLDGLSFFNEAEDVAASEDGVYDLEEYKRLFKTFNELYLNLEKYAFFISSQGADAEDDERIILAIHREKRRYALLNCDYPVMDEEIAIKEVSEKSIRQKVLLCRQNGYKEMIGHFSYDQ